MKAVVYRQYGGPEVLEYTDVPDPKLSYNSVLVRVRAAALHPADHMLQADLDQSHSDAWVPVIPGWDSGRRLREGVRPRTRVSVRRDGERLPPAVDYPSRLLVLH